MSGRVCERCNQRPAEDGDDYCSYCHDNAAREKKTEFTDEFVRWLMTETLYTLDDLNELFPEVPEFNRRRTMGQVEEVRRKLISTFESSHWARATK